MSFPTLLLYLLACLAVTVMPGPTMLLALANGTTRNWRIAGMGMLGAAVSDLLLIGAVGIGLGAVLAASEALFSLIKWLGVVYLVWLALQLWRAKPSGIEPQVASASAWRAFLRSLLVALSNPKGLLFFSAFLPQFIDTAASQTTQYATLAFSTACLDLFVMALYAAGGAQAARFLNAQGLRAMNRMCATMLLALAGLLAACKRASA